MTRERFLTEEGFERALRAADKVLDRIVQKIREEARDDEDPQVIVCQGPPVCELQGDEAEQAQREGCIWCKRIIVHEDGSETVIEPGRA